jgi:hypothetical protein
MSKRRNIDSKKKNTAKKYTPITRPNKRNIITRIIDFLKRFYVIIIGVIALAGAIPTYQYIKEKYFTSQHDKYINDTFIQGDLTPNNSIKFSPGMFKKLDVPPNFSNFKIQTLPPVNGIHIKFNQSNLLFFVVGEYAFACPKEELEIGISLILPKSCDSTSVLSMCVKENRLYVSTEFKDLKNEETVGYMEYNHWKLYRPNLFDYQTDNNRFLQVEDKQNNVIFSIHYWGSSFVYLAGYFISPNSINIIPNYVFLKAHDTCLLKSDILWKQKSLNLIAKHIKKIDKLKYFIE